MLLILHGTVLGMCGMGLQEKAKRKKDKEKKKKKIIKDPGSKIKRLSGTETRKQRGRQRERDRQTKRQTKRQTNGQKPFDFLSARKRGPSFRFTQRRRKKASTLVFYRRFYKE